MKKIICWIFGHKWEQVDKKNNGKLYVCKKCGELGKLKYVK